jgi:nicotinamidase-related amidase
MSSKRPWEGVIPADEIETYRLAGLGGPGGFGTRPALVVIDVQYRSVGERPQPIRDAIKQYSVSCGEAGWHAVTHIRSLVDVFRKRNWPILYPHVAPKSTHDRDSFAAKVPGVMAIPARGYEFVEEIAPRQTDIVIPKKQASAFFGTSLASYLIGLKVDTLILTGCTTSGCVRASAVDGCQLNFKIVVPEDAVFDRSPTSHAVNLFDMASKYADVMPTAELVKRLHSLGSVS